MAVLSAAARKKLPSKDFAGNKGKTGASGSYPIPDANHARMALSMVSKYGSSSKKAQVRAAVHDKYPGIGKTKPAYSRIKK